MKKLFLLLVLVFSTSMLFADFDIKIGVFKNVKNLRANIAKVKPYTFRKQIIVKKRKGFYYTYAIVRGSRSQAKKALKAYQRIFKDAFIAGQIKPSKKAAKKKISAKKAVTHKNTSKKTAIKKVPVKKKTSVKKVPIKKVLVKKVLVKKKVIEEIPKVVTPIVKVVVPPSMKKVQEQNTTLETNSTLKDTNLSSSSPKEVSLESQLEAIVEDDNGTDENISQVLVSPVITVAKVVETVDAKEALHLKTVYLCYEGGPAHLGHRVVQMTFNEETISYTPLGEDSILDIAYKIEENKVVLTLMDTHMVHKIVDNKENYLSVESYVGDKKMHTLRYYFSESLALKYVKEK